MTIWRWLAAGVVVMLGIVIAILATQIPVLGAAVLLHPSRRLASAMPESCRDATFAGVGVELKGWTCAASTVRRGTVVYLHGVADSRGSAAGVIGRFVARGFDVVAYDSRAHGDSDGTVCTYGFLETRDLRAVLDTIEPGPIVLLGTSLGAAVALQHAAEDARVSTVVAAETFSDLRTVAAERAPFFFTRALIARAFQIAERHGRFQIDAVSPVLAAAQITAPVLLIHGENDTDTSPDHSRRVFAALRGPKRLLIVPGAAHNGSLRSEVWDEVERWIDNVVAGERLGLVRPPAL
ncbi:MAG TPA: alpha/beta fold hydrolase [Vicinamibacterales bacterium]|nr:alpha/beta fold hydrolase [Vicinamibacterales bacterium]